MNGTVGLVLTGGGARAAYQVGVVDAVRTILRDAGWPTHRNPFKVLCGTSAGAINAAALAARADDFGQAVEILLEVWENFSPDQVYRTDLAGAWGNAAHWLVGLGFGWLLRTQPRSLFDNAPLAQLLHQVIDRNRIQRVLNHGHLDALAVTASSYTSGQHVTYYQTRAAVEPWYRTQRLATPAEITVDHLLASSAIPFVFPSVALPLQQRKEYFGDGSMRQVAPISPAIHLGADRIFIIGAAQLQRGTTEADHTGSQFVYPQLAQVAGHAMASIFLDALASDIERVERINRTISLLPESARKQSPLRPVDVLVIAPSERLDSLAAPYVRTLPRTVRTVLRMIGATNRRGSSLASYLLFEKYYTQRLIELGRRDCLAKRAAVEKFFMAEKTEPVGSLGEVLVV